MTAVARWAALAVVLLIAAALRLWDLGGEGYGTEYYAAGVRSMLTSWRLLLFNAFDPAGFISLDKPPLAFWVQATSAFVLGFSGFSIALPQAVEGLIAVALVWWITRRRAGDAAGIAAAAVLAISPVSVAIDRSNNTDTCLTLVLLCAAWAALRALETHRARWQFAAFALLGLGFNVKMLAALIAAPAFAALFWFGSRQSYRYRFGVLAGAGTVLSVIALAWPLLYDLTPPDRRPFVDSSRDNSMLELVVVHNGIERFILPARQTATIGEPAPDQANRLYDAVPTGPLRLADRHLAQQVLWLLPLALFGALIACRTAERTRWLAVVAVAWAVSYAVVYSFAGGIFHAYYLTVLAPPLAILTGLGVAALRDREYPRWRKAALLAAAGAWQVYLIAPWDGGTFRSLLTGAALIVIACAAFLRLLRAAPANGVLTAGFVALCIAPGVMALGPVIRPGNAMLPSAGMERFTRDGDPQLLRRTMAQPVLSADPRLLAYLLANQGQERFVAVTPDVRLAAPVIARTGLPVMAVGGFFGTSRIVTPHALDAMVRDGGIRFALFLLPRGHTQFPEAYTRQQRFRRWALRHGTPVDPVLWRSDRPESARLVLVDFQRPAETAR